MNDLYQDAVIDEARHARLLSLFRLEFRDPADMLEVVRGSLGDTNVATSFKKKDGRKLNAGTGHAGRRSAGKSPGR